MPQDSVNVFRRSLHRCPGDPGFLQSFYEAFVASSEEVRETLSGLTPVRRARLA